METDSGQLSFKALQMNQYIICMTHHSYFVILKFNLKIQNGKGNTKILEEQKDTSTS